MFREIKSFILHNTFKAFISAETAVKKLGGGKIVKNIFDTEPKYIGSSVRILKETDDATYIAKYDAKGRVDNNFKIMVTTDLHLWDEKDLIEKSLDMLARHLAAEKPDLLLITGDAILTDYQQLDCIQFGRFMEKAGIYWAYCFGNHEARAEKEFHKYFMLKNIESFPHCLSKFGDPELFGFGNFKINIMNADNTIRQSIFMFDSGRDAIPEHCEAHGVPTDLKGYDFIKQGQIDWYKNSIKELEAEHGKFKSMVLMHIPVKEYEEVAKPDGNGNYIPMLPSSYVFSAKATEFLWKLATEHSLPQAMYNSIAKSIKTQNSTPSVNIAQPITITMGDVIIKGNADKQTVADIKKQQENNL